MVVVAVLLAAFAERVDGWFSVSDLSAYFPLVDTQPTGARAVLSTIAGSIIGVAGVTFSVTMVAVSFASANFGPRLIGNFMRDRGNQMTLGVFIGTFVYALLILRTVRASDDSIDAFVPHFSVLVAVVLALASVGMLIYYIHHVPETINVGNIAANLGRDLHHGIHALFPDRDDLREATVEYGWVEGADMSDAVPIRATYSGYMQTLDEAQLVTIAEHHDLKIIVQSVPGDFVTPADFVMSVWPKSAVDEGVIGELLETYALGDQRTKHQNVAFVVEQLVEIIVRALSPGINDPFTAVTCLNWLRSGLEEFAQRETNAGQPDGDERVFLRPLSFVELLRLACDGSRQYVAQNGLVALHMIAMLAKVADGLAPGPRQNAVRDEIQKLFASSQAVLTDPSELAAIKERMEQIEADGLGTADPQKEL